MWISRVVTFYTRLNCFIVIGDELLKNNFRPTVCIVSVIAYVKFCHEYVT